MRIRTAFWKSLVLLLVLVGSWIRSSVASDYDNGVIPPPPRPFPDAYKDYQILPDSISPNNQYALIYPKRSVLFHLEELHESSLYLVLLKPFRILSVIPVTGPLAQCVQGWYDVNWAENSAAVVIVEGDKYTTCNAFLTTIRNGNVGSITDLVEEVSSQVAQDFAKSKAGSYSGCHNFVVADDFWSKWDTINKNQIKIACICTTNPKRFSKKAWNVRFQGVWDMSKGGFWGSEEITHDVEEKLP